MAMIDARFALTRTVHADSLSSVPQRASLSPNPAATVLLIDDSATARLMLSEQIQRTGMCGKVMTAADGFAGYQILLRGGVDLVLCDVNMPRCNGAQFLRMRSANLKLRSVPVIMLTEIDDTAIKIEALESGAVDYVAKNADPKELAARLAVHLHLKQVHDGLKREAVELDRQCRTDALTGLSTRRALREAMQAELSHARRYARPVSFVMIDVDHFKHINDGAGHQAGDQVLARIGQIVAGAARQHDTVARYGGEEIAVLLADTGLHGATLFAQRVRKLIEHEAFSFEGQTLRVTVSAGVASYSAPHVTTADALVRAADRALYQAKAAGRNCVLVSDVAVHQPSSMK